MKSMKKLVTLLLSLVMLCALAMPAMAEGDGNYSITITGTPGHTYIAYQVFQGVYFSGKDENHTDNKKEYLSDVEWGSDVEGEAIITDLKASSILGNSFTNKTNAEEVAYVLQNFENQSKEMDEFARIVGNHLKTTATGKSEGIALNEKTCKIEGLAAGYYLVKDMGFRQNDGSYKFNDGEIASKFLVKVVGNATVTEKIQVPTIKKEVANQGNHTSVDIGDDIDFKLTATVPDMANYNNYTFVIRDTLSDGLTFKDGSVAVTVAGDAFTDYEWTAPTKDKNEFAITFTKEKLSEKLEHNAGATIVVTYKATLNSNALTTDKETNTAKLEYSNNPSSDGKGTVKTPDVPVYIYDFDIEIAKYDGTNGDTDADKAKKLSGATFILYKVKDGKNLYYVQERDTTTKAVTCVTWTENKDEATKFITDENGKTTFQGIAAGTYYLHETQAPAGYNSLKKDVEVEITATYKENGELESSSATSDRNGQYIQVQSIANKAGAVLPSTGGIGTTIFYVLGSILALGAAVLLIVKKRMNGQDR